MISQWRAEVSRWEWLSGGMCELSPTDSGGGSDTSHCCDRGGGGRAHSENTSVWLLLVGGGVSGGRGSELNSSSEFFCSDRGQNGSST